MLAAAESGDGELALSWLDWLNPLNRSRDREGVEHYRIEPYVIAGDVYGHPPFTGRGGWSWYTGSAAWIHRVAIENVLGIERRGNKLFFRPCLPDEWPRFEISIRHLEAIYRIAIHHPGRFDGKNTSLVEHGRLLPGTALTLEESGNHEIQVFPNVGAWNDWRDASDRAVSSPSHKRTL
jgi:cellobiose phosphorylase